MAKKPRIVVEFIEGKGTRTRIDNAYSRDHAIYMLTEAIAGLVLPEKPEEVAEVVEDEPVQELPSADGEEEEVKLSDLSN